MLCVDAEQFEAVQLAPRQEEGVGVLSEDDGVRDWNEAQRGAGFEVAVVERSG